MVSMQRGMRPALPQAESALPVPLGAKTQITDSADLFGFVYPQPPGIRKAFFHGIFDLGDRLFMAIETKLNAFCVFGSLCMATVDTQAPI